MEHEEIELALEELENRLERLRALYEQYFLGIEKIEPTVARKDVDRRFWILRRTPIRNTARRFKLQTLIQRYNTFQQYWARVCREIENGTYTRHLIRAQQKFGAEPRTWAAKKRLGRLRKNRDTDAPPPAGTAKERAEQDLQAMLQEPTTPEEATRRALEAAARAGTRPAAPLRRPSGELNLDIEDLAALPPSSRRFRPATSARAFLPNPPRSTAPEQPAAAERAEATGTKPASARPATPDRPRGWGVLSPNPAQPKARSPAAKGGISDDRVRELHAELVAKRRQLNESAGVSLESLGKSLRATARKLRESKGGNVDFRVVVKDGKAVVRPIVRK